MIEGSQPAIAIDFTRSTNAFKAKRVGLFARDKHCRAPSDSADEVPAVTVRLLGQIPGEAETSLQ